MTDKLLNLVIAHFEGLGLTPSLSQIISRIITGSGVALLAFFFWFITARVVLRFIGIIVARTKNTWDDDLVTQGVFRRIIHIVPAITVWFMAPIFLAGLPELLHFTRIVTLLGVIISLTLTFLSFLKSINSIYERRQDAARRPIKGLIQAFQILIVLAALILAFSVVTAQPITGLLAGMGAVSAIILLIFKDPLMGLVAGFHIASNDMVRLGDWIEVPSQGADGDVIDISLLNVTVQNWDRTWVTFPIQALTSGGFKNWRGMSTSGGRRIKRSLSIDLSSIRFVNKDEIEQFKSIHLLKEYLETRSREIIEYNKKHHVDRGANPLNGRALTNVGVFRTYAKSYVCNHPKVNNKMTLLVRQLQSGPTGLPLELYFFSSDKIWDNYETIQSDIFDHLFASLREFGLRAFQNPAGSDLQNLREQMPVKINDSRPSDKTCTLVPTGEQ